MKRQTCASAMITVRSCRALDLLFNGEERDNAASGLMQKQGTPSLHALNIAVIKLSTVLKTHLDIVSKRTFGIDGATGVSKSVKPVKLRPSLPLLAGLKNRD
ncbi:hypothetical protein FCV25MIE_33429 [Fagus crenata]